MENAAVRFAVMDIAIKTGSKIDFGFVQGVQGLDLRLLMFSVPKISLVGYDLNRQREKIVELLLFTISNPKWWDLEKRRISSGELAN